jgi:superoxide dismutase, Cu-Zn family
MRVNRIAALSIGCAAFELAACVTIDNGNSRQDNRPVASATLLRSDGAPAGMASVQRVGREFVLRVEVRGLSAGLHGIHVHAVGRCNPPDFASAHGHWNPGGRAHGAANPNGKHAGDLPNLQVDASGIGRGAFPLDAAATGAGAEGLLDGDGAAVVIHAAADDLRSDPSGNSGARIACGVLMPA